MEHFGIQGEQPAIRLGAFMPGGARSVAAGMRVSPLWWLTSVGAPIATGVFYFLAAKLGEWLAFPSAPVSALWAPNAIVLAALILTPRERWWIFLVAVLPFHFFAQWPEFPVSQVVTQYVVNLVEALIGAVAIEKLCPQPRRYDRVRTALVLIAFGGIIGPLLTSVVMAAAFVAAGIPGDFWLTVVVRTLTNTFAVVALVPLIVHVTERLRTGSKEVTLARAAEALAIALFLIGVGFVVFVLAPEGSLRSPALLYAPLPVLVWAATRFGVPGACSAALLLGAVSTWGVLNERGPFAAAHPVENALSVVLFQVVTCIGLVAFAALLEEWKQAARALASSEARFRSIFENNIIPTAIWRDGGIISQTNAAFLQLTGLSQADIENGLRLDTLTAWAREPEVREPTEKELLLRDGKRIPVIVSRCRFSGEGGGVIYALDLSAFRRAEARRRSVEGLHTAVLASLHDQVAILDSSGTIVEINDSWRRFVDAAPCSRFDRVLPGENFVTACARAAEHGEEGASDQLDAVRAVLDGSENRRLLHLSGPLEEEPSWFEVSIEQLRRPEGGAVVMRTDVTARMQAEIDARNQRQQLTHLGRAAVLGQLSGAFAHELNQPLTSILGNAEAGLRLIERGASDPTELRDILRDIVQDDERAAQVIRRLRALLDKGDMQRHPVDLNTIVREVLDLARSELITRNVYVGTELDTHAPLVMGDRVQMQQVMLNLLMNACESMTGIPVVERRVTVATRFLVQYASVELAVTDSGCGIPPGEEERIFQPFVTTKAHGMGLGLAICRSVAESHQGRLWAENADPRGAVFRLQIPIEGGTS